jgi:hypothetical protein
LRRIAILGSAGSTDATYALAQLRLQMIAAERDTVITMRDRNEIGDTVMRKLLSEFDHEELLLNRHDC